MHAQLAPGSAHRPLQELEATDALQRFCEEHFLAREVLLVEAAGLQEVLSGSEEERTGAEIRREVHRSKDAREHGTPERHTLLQLHPRSAARAAGTQRSERIGHVRRGDARVSVDKEQDLASSRLCAGISHGRDVPEMNGNHARSGGGRDVRRRIGGAIVHHDDLVSRSCLRQNAIYRAR